MFNHQPPDYHCPFCALLRGERSDKNEPDDIVYRNDHVTATISPKWWGSNHGHVLIIPNEHYENLYDTPDEIAAEIYKAAKKISIAIRETYDCDGTSNRQHNEPAGNQAVWHLHMHVFPRYNDDKLYQNHEDQRSVTAPERKHYADKLKAYFAANP